MGWELFFVSLKCCQVTGRDMKKGEMKLTGADCVDILAQSHTTLVAIAELLRRLDGQATEVDAGAAARPAGNPRPARRFCRQVDIIGRRLDHCSSVASDIHRSNFLSPICTRDSFMDLLRPSCAQASYSHLMNIKLPRDKLLPSRLPSGRQCFLLSTDQSAVQNLS